jgi:AdoMet-dependent heme synthase
VQEGALARVYRHDPYFAALRDHGRLGGKCAVCEYREACGGSRSRAKAMTGDVFAADPACAYLPAGWSGRAP